MMSHRYWYLTASVLMAVALLVGSGMAVAQVQEPVSRTQPESEVWYGVMKAGGREFRFVIEQVTDAEGVTFHQLTSLDEGGQTFRMDDVMLTDDAFEFDLKATAAEYRGTRTEDTATGTWKQRGSTFDLTFHRHATRPEDVPAEVWTGEIDAIIQKLKIQLRVYPDESGGERILMDSLTQKSGGFVAHRTVNGTSLKLDVPVLSGQFEGTLDASGTSATGKWTQNLAVMNMSLTRLAQPVAQGPETANRPQTPRPPFPYEVREVTFDSTAEGVRMAGTLTVPAGATAAPAVILISGSGPQDRDETIVEHKPFLVLADHLTRQGIAVLRYDDRGTAKSTGTFSTSTTMDFAADAAGAVAFLRQQSGVNPAAIGVIGHSEGGLIAPLVATQRNDIAFVVLIAGPGVNGKEILLSQGELILRASGIAGQAELRAQRLTQTALIDAVLRARPDDDPATLQQRALTKLLSDLPPELAQEAQVRQAVVSGINTLNTPWFRFFLNHEPGPVLRQLTCPVLAVNGEKDVQVDPKLNLPAIRTALKNGNHPDFELIEIPAVNHLLQPCRTGNVTEYSTIEETMSEDALTTISTWITKRFPAETR